MNKLMPFQVKRLFELAEEGEGPVSSRQLLSSIPDIEEAINRGRQLHCSELSNRNSV